MNLIENILNFHFWDKVFFSNTLGEYAIALLIFVGLYIVIWIVESFILSRLRNLTKRTKTNFDDSLIQAIETINHSFYLFIAFYVSVKTLTIHSAFEKTLAVILIFWIVYQFVEFLDEIMKYFINRKIKQEDKSTASALRLVRKITKGVLWVLGLLLVLSNLGVNITSLVAGLGIGGVAIALAVQNILSDLFSSFSIYFDKPFVVGDLIVVDDVTGTVEKIGIKTTRIRSLKGEEVVISNQRLTNAKIENYKKMDERRIVFSLGVKYSTPHETLEEIPQIIENCIKSVDQTRFDRSNLVEYEDSAIKFETVYYVESQDFNVYRNKHEQILLKIRKELKKKDISMPFPTRTVHVEGNINNN